MIQPYTPSEQKANNRILPKKDHVTEVTSEKAVHAGQQGEPATTIKKNAQRPLTYKEREYIKQRISGKTQPQAVQAVYDVRTGVAERTLKNMAQRIEHRPAVLAVLTEHATRAEEMLVKLAEDTSRFASSGTKEGAMYASTAERTLNSMLDRVHGKAKQSIDVQSSSVSISIDMSGVTDTDRTKLEQ
jgi:hypothetical protein